jgi:copper chaperone CopZ
VSFFIARGNRAVEPNDPQVRTSALTEEGMACQGCSDQVAKVVRDVPGILGVKMDSDKKLPVVASPECCPAPTDALIYAHGKAGYRGALAEPVPPAGADRGKTDARPIDPDRQVVFTVQGFT